MTCIQSSYELHLVRILIKPLKREDRIPTPTWPLSPVIFHAIPTHGRRPKKVIHLILFGLLIVATKDVADSGADAVRGARGAREVRRVDGCLLVGPKWLGAELSWLGVALRWLELHWSWLDVNLRWY
jgi:hypothetical protein